MAPFFEMKEILEGNKGGTASRDYTSLAAYSAARDFFAIKASLNGQACKFCLIGNLRCRILFYVIEKTLSYEMVLSKK